MNAVRLGIAGLGRAFSLMLPTLRSDPRISMVAAADPRPEARERFALDFGGRVFESIERLCEDPQVDAVYIASPHQFHADQACMAAAAGKHVLVEKPMALSLEECRAMIAAAKRAGVQLIVGHSHSFDAPVSRARELIASGAYGRLRMVHAFNYTDFLYRPRRAEELDTRSGGGVIFNQAAHQVDVVRLLAGARVREVHASTAAWDPARPTEGAYSCLLRFDDGAFATLVYSGYAHFDSDELMEWVGELGAPKDPSDYGSARRALAADETGLKTARNYGGPAFRPLREPVAHQHFGPLIASCEGADLRPLATGVMIYADSERRFDPVALRSVPRAEVVDELYEALAHGRPPLHDGAWAMATLEVCLAMLRSSAEGKAVAL